MSGDSMTANHLEHEIATFPRITGAGRIGVSGRPAIAYSRVDTGRNPSAGPSNSNFPASHLDSVGLIAQSYRAFSSPATLATYTIARPPHHRSRSSCSGGFPSRSSSAEKATARQDRSGQPIARASGRRSIRAGLLADGLSTKAKAEGGKSVTCSAQPTPTL